MRCCSPPPRPTDDQPARRAELVDGHRTGHRRPNLYLDLSTANIVFAVRLAIAEVPDRTLFGSDAPYGDPVLARATVERATRPGTLRDQVLGGTLAELLDR